MVDVRPGRAFGEVFEGWMGAGKGMGKERGKVCWNWAEMAGGPRDFFKVLNQTQIITDELAHLIFEVEKFYPGIEFERGGVLMPDFAFGNNASRLIVMEAINNTIFQKTQYPDEIIVLPTDFGVAADKAIGLGLDNLDTWNYDALVVTNTSTLLSASWFQFSFTQHAVGTDAHAKIDFPYLTAPNANGTAGEVARKPDLSRIKTFIESKEKMYTDKTSIGKRLMSGNTRLILRLNTTSDNEIHEFGKEMNKILKGTRFDPSKTTTTVYREETEDRLWMWTPAFYMANETKSQLDSSKPDSCLEEPEACKELKDCIKREALGELIICEEPSSISNDPSPIERLEEGVRGGYWTFYRDNIFVWLDILATELEARTWLFICREDMPWSSTSTKLQEKCSAAIAPLPTFSSPSPSSSEAEAEDEDDDSKQPQGILSPYLGLPSLYLYTLPHYYLTGSIIYPLTHIPLFYIGTENILKLVFWGMHRMLGQELYDAIVDVVVQTWESDLKEFFEEVMELSAGGGGKEGDGSGQGEVEGGKGRRENVRWRDD